MGTESCIVQNFAFEHEFSMFDIGADDLLLDIGVAIMMRASNPRAPTSMEISNVSKAQIG